MSLFANPQEHAANPPETWTVRRVAASLWHLTTKAGVPLEYGIKTKRAADELRESGHLVDLYEKERRWYDGESVAGWRPYAEVVRKP